tara:strand:- start:1612 stop:2349 length:738 start_codon:yes stop_codon:yes gene_type:complete
MENKEIDLLNENPISYSNIYFSNEDNVFWHITKIKEYLTKFQDEKSKKVDLQNINYKNIINEYIQPYKEGDILIYDNKIDQKIIQNINYNMLPKCTWTIQGPSKEVNDVPIFFKFNLENNKYFQSLFYNYIIPNIEYKNKDKLRIVRNYINLNMAGLPGYWHKDAPGLGPTILIYLNDTWNTTWAGQTAFYTDRNNLDIKYIDVKPGRIVIFKPSLEHMACDLSVYALTKNIFRYTLAYHTYYEF